MILQFQQATDENTKKQNKKKTDKYPDVAWDQRILSDR